MTPAFRFCSTENCVSRIVTTGSTQAQLEAHGWIDPAVRQELHSKTRIGPISDSSQRVGGREK